MAALEIPHHIYTAMLDHGNNNVPMEACGIVSGRGNQALKFYPTDNADRSPIRYSIPPEQILRVFRTLEEDDQQLLAIFHTHPTTAAYPSVTDIRLAFYPEAVYLIMSLAQPGVPVLRGFHIRAGTISEREITILK